MRILDEQEKAIVRYLIRDPRESDNGVGERTGVNVRTVSRKRIRLEQEGVLAYFTNIDLSGDGAKQYNARHLYIIKFKVGITYNQLVDEIRQESNQQSVFTETIFESHIAEIDGKVALLLFVDGNSDLDIVQRTHEELIPGLLKNHGSDSIESISTIRLLSPVRVMRNYIPMVNMVHGFLRPDWPDEGIYVGKSGCQGRRIISLRRYQYSFG
ncbi:MAG: Lrp/AsnC family transcriptional regulator [Verrucomicrobia bacterium]|nr:Lrp/AsnC family transcriptional regulator [Verrucomicrobiota bacterium]